MSYHYLDESRREDPHALADVEVFYHPAGTPRKTAQGWYYGYGRPGYLWDSDPVGPFDTEQKALKEAREAAGFCEHGVSDEGVCEECLPCCAVCGEKSCSTGSLIGYAHRWGPVDHPFTLSDNDARRWGRNE